MNALAGQFHPSTIRVTGRSGGKEEKVLIDSGSNNNFVAPSVAEKLNLKQTATKEFKVGNGGDVMLYCMSKCEKVNLKIQGHDFYTDFFLRDQRVEYCIRCAMVH